jgi:hypothetical protein
LVSEIIEASSTIKMVVLCFVLLQRKRNLRRKTSLEIDFFMNRKAGLFECGNHFAARPGANKTYFY